MAEIEERLTKFGKELGVEVVCAQTNYEGTSDVTLLWKTKDRSGSEREGGRKSKAEGRIKLRKSRVAE